MSGRSVAVVLTLFAGFALAGCYGTTDPATDVGPESATLNAHGTANNGPASALFRYWLVGENIEDTTVPQHFPAGASGPISQKVSGLAADSEYAFKLCGSDDGSEGACANTRTFRTLPAVEDSLIGGYQVGCCSSWTVNAHAGPNGENAHGGTSYASLPPFVPGTEFKGFVSCLEVDGGSAAVGAIGQIRHLGSQDPSWQRASMLMTVVDSRFGTDTHGSASFGDGSVFPNCASADFNNQSADGRFVVNDAQSSPD